MFHPASQGPIDSSDELTRPSILHRPPSTCHASSRLQGRSFRRFSPGCGSKRRETRSRDGGGRNFNSIWNWGQHQPLSNIYTMTSMFFSLSLSLSLHCPQVSLPVLELCGTMWDTKVLCCCAGLPRAFSGTEAFLASLLFLDFAFAAEASPGEGRNPHTLCSVVCQNMIGQNTFPVEDCMALYYPLVI